MTIDIMAVWVAALGWCVGDVLRYSINTRQIFHSSGIVLFSAVPTLLAFIHSYM